MSKERVYSCVEEVAMRLKEYRKYEKASLMVGAGFSKNAISKGMKNIQPPNWNELAIICDEDCRTFPVKNASMVNTVQQAMLVTF